jgi:hypothetical protein
MSRGVRQWERLGGRVENGQWTLEWEVSWDSWSLELGCGSGRCVGLRHVLGTERLPMKRMRGVRALQRAMVTRIFSYVGGEV